MTITVSPIYGHHNVQNLLNAVSDKSVTRLNFAELYADVLAADAAGSVIPWGDINDALLTRYKRSGLEWIKRAAHKLYLIGSL